MDLIGDLFNDPTKIIFILLSLIGVLFSAFLWARKELNASKVELQDIVRKKDDAKRAEADRVAKFTEAQINARWPQ